MNRAGRILFILGFVISIFAGLGVFIVLVLSQPKPAVTPSTKVVLAAQEIASRTEIMPNQIVVSLWPSAVPPPAGAFTDPDEVVGKLALGAIYPGQPILQNMLIEKPSLKDVQGTASLWLEKGTVGTAMPVTVKTNVAEAIQPGDRVDVIATFKSQSTSPTAASAVATQRLLSNVLVLQVGPWPNPGAKVQSSGYTIVTFQLQEQEALVLEYATLNAVNLTLVLRPANDREALTLEPVTFDYINQRYGFKLPR